MKREKNGWKRRTAAFAALFAACALLSLSCGKKTDEPGENAVEEAAEKKTEAADMSKEEETAGEATEGEKTAAKEPAPAAKENTEISGKDGEGAEETHYGVMYASVAEVKSDADGLAVYCLQDLSDPENVWTIGEADIGSVLTDLSAGSRAALLYSGDMAKDADQVTFIAAVPSASYELGRTEGVTESNAMSTFTLKTADGRTQSFLKDGCRIEDGALSSSEGDAVIVYYAYSPEDDLYYPMEIFAADKTE